MDSQDYSTELRVSRAAFDEIRRRIVADDRYCRSDLSDSSKAIDVPRAHRCGGGWAADSGAAATEVIRG